jgi:hypothetical protein
MDSLTDWLTLAVLGCEPHVRRWRRTSICPSVTLKVLLSVHLRERRSRRTVQQTSLLPHFMERRACVQHLKVSGLHETQRLFVKIFGPELQITWGAT